MVIGRHDDFVNGGFFKAFHFVFLPPVVVAMLELLLFVVALLNFYDSVWLKGK